MMWSYVAGDITSVVQFMKDVQEAGIAIYYENINNIPAESWINDLTMYAPYFHGTIGIIFKHDEHDSAILSLLASPMVFKKIEFTEKTKGSKWKNVISYCLERLQTIIN